MALSAKNIVVFGSTGNTGLAVLETALKHGFEVTAFLRDAAKLPTVFKDKVTVVVGNVLNKGDVNQVIAGKDAVIVTLGTRTDLGPTTDLSEGTRNIVNAMKQLGVKRISACISAFLFYEPEKVPPQYQEVTNDHRRQAEVLKNSGLEWIAICPPHITNDPGTGSYKVASGKSPGHNISKFDLADLLIKCLRSDEYLQQMIGMGYPKV